MALIEALRDEVGTVFRKYNEATNRTLETLGIRLLAAYTGRIRGIAPGTATVTATYSGLTSTLQIRVDP